MTIVTFLQLHVTCGVYKVYKQPLFQGVQLEIGKLFFFFSVYFGHHPGYPVSSLVPRLFLVEERGNEPGDEATLFPCPISFPSPENDTLYINKKLHRWPIKLTVHEY